jgi:ATP-binding cassette subfamily C protein CydCD
LTGAQVILIDEPTAHLDAESADRLMADLRVALRDRITVLVTHQAHGVRPEDPRVNLDALAGRRDSALAVAA